VDESNNNKFNVELLSYLKYIKYQETFCLIIFKLFEKYFKNIQVNLFQELKYNNQSLYFALDSISKNEINRKGVLVWYDLYLIEKML